MEKDQNTSDSDQDFNILSFAIPSENELITDEELVPIEPPLEGIWSDLEKAIRSQVTKDGINEDAVLPGQTTDEILEDAIAIIYSDVSEFYSWYFNPDDDRSDIIKDQKKVDIPPELRKVVKATVNDNLDAMREVGEIPTGLDVEGLDDVITDSLSRYILNWQDWFYDRKREEDIDNYYEQKSFYDEMYINSDYGNEDNLLDNDQYDGISDVPYLSDELGLEDTA